jgi:hypothetical protein
VTLDFFKNTGDRSEAEAEAEVVVYTLHYPS